MELVIGIMVFLKLDIRKRLVWHFLVAHNYPCVLEWQLIVGLLGHNLTKPSCDVFHVWCWMAPLLFSQCRVMGTSNVHQHLAWYTSTESHDYNDKTVGLVRTCCSMLPVSNQRYKYAATWGIFLMIESISRTGVVHTYTKLSLCFSIYVLAYLCICVHVCACMCVHVCLCVC